MNKIYYLYAKLFAKKAFYRYNRVLFHLSLRGMGILNYQDDRISGESFLVNKGLKKIIKGNAPVLIDVGANVGDYTDLLASIFPQARVFSFEPHPGNFEKLSSRGIKNVQAFQAGLGEKNEVLRLYDRSEQDGSQHATIYEKVITDIHKVTATFHEITIIRLDEFLTEQGIQHVDFLKIDTEGNEFSVLEGAGSFITEGKITCIQFEFNEMNIISRRFIKNFNDLLPKYDLYRLLPNGLVKLNYSPVDNEIFGFQNIVALLKGNSID